MSKAKIGDKIRIICGDEPYYSTGDLAIVCNDYVDCDDVYADFTGNAKHHRDGKWFVPADDFVIEPAQLTVKIKRLSPDAVIPKYATQLSAGFDLVAVEDVVIAPGATGVKVPLGLAFEIPPGYVMYVMMRSGIALKTKLRQSNGIGVIDADYRGEVAMLFDNVAPDNGHLTNEYRLISGDRAVVPHDEVSPPEGTYWIRKGDRVCQAIIQRYEPVMFVEVADLSETERGSGGFGHSGVSAE